MNKNGGCQNIQSKKSASKLQIIGDTPEMTDDIKATIDYLENIIINKDTLQTLDAAKLVLEINSLIQYVEVLSIYKRPVHKLFELYEDTIARSKSMAISAQRKHYLQQKKSVIEEVLGTLKLNEAKVNRKEYFEDYE